MLCPPLWAHIDWLSAPPKAEQHGAPAAAVAVAAAASTGATPPPPKNVKEKQTEEEKQEASVQPVRLCSGNENQSGLSESISQISVLLLAALQLSSQTIHNNTTDL